MENLENDNAVLRDGAQAKGASNPTKEDLFVNPAAEKFVSGLAKVLLWLGIVVAVILFLASIALFSSYEAESAWVCLFVSVYCVFMSVFMWAFLRVFVNISRNLFNIHTALKDKR